MIEEADQLTLQEPSCGNDSTGVIEIPRLTRYGCIDSVQAVTVCHGYFIVTAVWQW